MRNQLLDAIAQLAPAGVRCGVLPIDETRIADLAHEERALIATAGSQRAAEFATGRAVLHQLLDETTSLNGGPITRTSNGAPAWPEGVVGSLAHDRRHVVAVIGPADQYRSLGIDIECLHESDDELHETVLRPDDPPIDAAAAFVIKEAAYKAWSDCGGALIDHLAVRLRVDGDNFTAEMPAPHFDVQGKFAAACGSWIAVAAIPARSWPG